MEKKKKEADAKPGIGAWFKSLEAEFKKSVAVIASAVSLGFLIALLDAIIKFGFGFIIK